MTGDLEALEELTQRFGDFPTGSDDFVQRRWITNAIDCGSAAVVEWMIEKKAPLIFRDDEGFTVLHSAIAREAADKYKMISALLEAGADVNAKGRFDWTPAHLAAVSNDAKALQLLHENGADFSIRTEMDNYATPLEEAIAFGGSPESAAYLENITEQYVAHRLA